MTLVVDWAVKSQHKQTNTPKNGNGHIQWIGMEGPLGKYRLNTIIFLKSLYLNKDRREVKKAFRH